MKKVLSSILISLIIFANLLAPFSVGFGTKNTPEVVVNKAEAADCALGTITVPPLTKDSKRPDKISVSVDVTDGCVNKSGIVLEYIINEKDSNFLGIYTLGDVGLGKGIIKGPLLSNVLKFSFTPGEMACDSGVCNIYYTIKILQDGKVVDEYTNGDTEYSCITPTCDDTMAWAWTVEAAEPTTDFWWFDVTYKNGDKTEYKPYLSEKECKDKWDGVTVSNGAVKSECQKKTNEQIKEAIIYYYEIIKDGNVEGKSQIFSGENGQKDCEAERLAFSKDAKNSGFTTSECKTETTKQVVGGLEQGGDIQNTSSLPACGLGILDSKGTIMGCVAQAFYYVFFVPTSFVFGLSGKILDFTIMYSISDGAYRSEFVLSGWTIIKDFCNMFFIFILLYVAFGTILSLHSVKTKEMIINVVIIGLLINFSLFTTQVIIDASNILTRVFYNADTISTGSKKDGEAVKGEAGDFGEIKLSEAIVTKVNPQELLTNSDRIEEIPKRNGLNTGDTDRSSNGISIGSFILVVLLSTAVNVVGTIAFLSSALIFIGRVVMLWMAMILSPLVFFSYTVPEMQSIKMIGWKKWWPETLSLAFVAPVFAFFMYIIVGFLGSGLGIKELLSSNSGGLNFVIGIVVPFAFIMILLMKAKSIAVDMSGEMGAAMAKAGSTVGGLALGGAVGVGAMAMRGTIGRVGSAIANSDRLKASEAKGGFGGFLSKNLRNVGTKAGTGSFDVRATKAGAAAGKGMGIDMGKAKEGGFIKARAENVAARQKRAKELERGEDSPETQAVRSAERALHAVKTDRTRQDALLGLNNGIAFADKPEAITKATENRNATETIYNNLNSSPTATAEEIRLAKAAFDESKDALTSAMVADKGLGGLEREIVTAEEAVAKAERVLKDATDTLKSWDPTDTAGKATQTTLVERLRTNRDAQINGTNLVDLTTGNIITGQFGAGRDQAKANLKARQATIRNQERPVHIAEDNLKKAENAKIEVNNQIIHDYAHSIQGAWSNAINGVISLGEHSGFGEREAANKILSGAKEAQKITEHH